MHDDIASIDNFEPIIPWLMTEDLFKDIKVDELNNDQKNLLKNLFTKADVNENFNIYKWLQKYVFNGYINFNRYENNFNYNESFNFKVKLLSHYNEGNLLNLNLLLLIKKLDIIFKINEISIEYEKISSDILRKVALDKDDVDEWNFLNYLDTNYKNIDYFENKISLMDLESNLADFNDLISKYFNNLNSKYNEEEIINISTIKEVIDKAKSDINALNKKRKRLAEIKFMNFQSSLIKIINSLLEEGKTIKEISDMTYFSKEIIDFLKKN